ncbi:MAG: adenylate kinase, partial [Acidimicrobiales bacterium]
PGRRPGVLSSDGRTAPVTAGVRLVMLGRQGAGKGTQCTRLSRHYVVPHISTGEMLRAAAKEGTELGRKAAEIMNEGGLVPDDVMIGIVDERLDHDDTTRRGYILDGFPRTVPQAKALAEITVGRPLDMVIDLDVPQEVVLRRLASRRVCADCGANYSVDKPPRYDCVCDNCGGEVEQREDDTPAAIEKRLAEYERETAPLIDWYRDRGLLEVVDGQGSTNEVSQRLFTVIDVRRGG